MAKPLKKTSPSLHGNKNNVSFTRKTNMVRVNWQKPSNTFDWVVFN